MLAPAAIDQMTLTERLQAMESLWDHLRQHEEEVPVPDWHKALLDERLKLVEQGKAHFSDWDEAKKRIAARTR
jgi:putative addiction module component (TIGR02574 family)